MILDTRSGKWMTKDHQWDFNPAYGKISYGSSTLIPRDLPPITRNFHPQVIQFGANPPTPVPWELPRTRSGVKFNHLLIDPITSWWLNYEQARDMWMTPSNRKCMRFYSAGNAAAFYDRILCPFPGTLIPVRTTRDPREELL